MFKKTGMKMKALGVATFFALASMAQAAPLVTYDAAKKTTAWDTSGFVAEIMKAFTAGISILMIFLPLAIGVMLIIKYTQRGVKA